VLINFFDCENCFFHLYVYIIDNEVLIMNFSVDRYRRWFWDNQQTIRQDFMQFLRLSSISTDPAYRDACWETAQWLVAYLQRIGLKALLLQGPGLPVVFAETVPNHGSPSMMFYHHYDVQPVDPIALWDSPPFEPKWRDGKVFARGASDNKGQCFATLTALRAIYELEGSFPMHIKLFIEGEEESGGESTRAILHKHQELLRADALCVIDCDSIALDQPSIVLGFRGLMACEIECSNAHGDLHSGSHGGIAANPLRIMSHVLSQLWDVDGKVQMEHFYDEIISLSEEEKDQLDLDFDEVQYQRSFGVKVFHREKGFSYREANWLRPTAEINGLWGGYTGIGFKTVLPAKAHAKVSFRLVPGQDPAAIYEQFVAFLHQRVPPGTDIRVTWHHGAKACRLSTSSSLIRAVASSMEAVYQKPCRYTAAGGSIPIVTDLMHIVGGETALFGFALDTDNIHAPNEHFYEKAWENGMLTIASLCCSPYMRCQGVNIS